MKHDSNDADHAWLESLGFEGALIDRPSGTRMIRVLFGNEAEEDAWIEDPASADQGFACVA